MVFDLVIHSKANQSLGAVVDLLLELLDKSDEAVVYLMKNRVFAPSESLGRDEKNFFEMLCSHQDGSVREMASRVLCFLLRRLLMIEGEEPVALIIRDGWTS